MTFSQAVHSMYWLVRTQKIIDTSQCLSQRPLKKTNELSLWSSGQCLIFIMKLVRQQRDPAHSHAGFMFR
jgi:hypothetical protein